MNLNRDISIIEKIYNYCNEISLMITLKSIPFTKMLFVCALCKSAN